VSSDKTCFNINGNFIRINVITSIGTLELIVTETVIQRPFNLSAAGPRSKQWVDGWVANGDNGFG
jgi:hypothetical protein